MKLVMYELTEEVYQYYKKHIKGNENVSYELAQKKLNRNLLLAKCLVSNGHQALFSYGHLLIEIKDNEIVFIKNHSPIPYGWRKSDRELLLINRRMGIYNAIKSKVIG